MALTDDVNLGLRSLSRDATMPLSLDPVGECEIGVEIPASVTKLAGKKLTILVRLSRARRLFSLLAPIAVARIDIPGAVVNQLFADQLLTDYVLGTTFALERETGVVFATYHWVLESISPEQFVELFQHFASAAFTLLDRMGTIAAGVDGISTLRDGEIR